MNILFVTPRLPYPLDTGAKIRTFNLIKNIARRHTVKLLTFLWEDQESACVKEVEKYVSQVITIPGPGFSLWRIICGFFVNMFYPMPFVIRKYSSRRMKNELKKLLKKEQFDLIHFDHLHMAQYSALVKDKPVVLDEHNIENTIWHRYRDSEKNFFKKLLFALESKRMKRYEEEISKNCNLCLTVSANYMNVLKALSPKSNVAVISNGVDIDYFFPTDREAEPRNLVYTGSMNWLPNEDAMLYFVKDILPLIKKEIPDIRLCVVGQSPTEKIRRLSSDEYIVVTGAVAYVRPYIAKSQIFIVPLRIGGGTRLKILEAMAMKKPIVSTAIGYEGIEVTPGSNIVTADNPEEFSRAIIMLFRDRESRGRYGENGRKLVEEKYSWEIISLKLEKEYIALKDKII